MERIGYKVVTEKMESLGLRKNPNILTFVIGQWTELNEDQIKPGKSDWGGIWLARGYGGANTLRKYMREKYDINTLIYLTNIGIVLFENSGLIIKTCW